MYKPHNITICSIALMAFIFSIFTSSIHAQSSTPEKSSAAAFDNSITGIGTYNIISFGAIRDGKTLNTAAIQAAIDACAKNNGGTVLVPAGDFLTGTIELKSNVTLHLAAAARLLGSGKIEDYKAGNNIPSGNGNIVLISAADAKNVTIEGRGTIDGQGVNFYTGKGDGSAPGERGNADSQANRVRPHLMIFARCENLLVRDVFLTASAYHCVRILNCKFVRMDGVRIYNRVNKNNDGFHFNSCQYVNVSNCNITCQDDACALFGSNKFVNITNCNFSTRWSIFRFGGGQVENITVSNCTISETYGCPIKISTSGERSTFENVTFSNIIMKDVTGPISINASRGATVRNVAFNGIRASVVKEPLTHADMPFPVMIYDGERYSCLTINGLSGAKIENISFTDVQVTYAGGGTAEQGAVRDIGQNGGEYFGAWKAPLTGPPAYGMYARNVKGLRLDNVRFEVKEPDLRPAVIFDHVTDAILDNLSVQANEKSESALRVIDSENVLLSANRLLTPTPVFMSVEGAANKDIKIDGGDLTKAEKPLTFGNNAKADMVKIRE
jgi:hypothetical protein